MEYSVLGTLFQKGTLQILQGHPRGFGTPKISEVVQGIYRFKRTPATHCFVMMISSALRDRKPYAIPIQCFPYAGLKEGDMRRLVTNIVKEMTKEGMEVAGKSSLSSLHKVLCVIIFDAGFVSNGEFNFLRSKGYTRPLSVLQIRTNVRNKCSKYKLSDLLEMLTPKGRHKAHSLYTH